MYGLGDDATINEFNMTTKNAFITFACGKTNDGNYVKDGHPDPL